jgi:FOG: Ankyrin repeat
LQFYSISTSSKSNIFQRLPLHIALNRGAPVDVIKALIDADEGGRSVRAETHDGMRPIHAALGPKPSYDIIRLLTSADSKISDYEDGEADILSEYKGLLPIHMACLNKSTQNIVSILLDKDVEGITLFEKASDRRSKSYNDSFNDAMKSTSFSSKALARQKPALHYAILHSTDDVILLLLNRLELEGDASASILDANSEGQSALHLACMKNTSPYIIKMLLKIDCDKKSVAAFDKDGLRPIHYACDHEDAQRKSIEYLLKAEKEFREMNNTIPSSEKSPFWYACKAQAPPDVLELLVSQPGFNLRDFDRVSLRHDLADSIKVNPNLQRQINLKMARRFNFSKYVHDFFNMRVIFHIYLFPD